MTIEVATDIFPLAETVTIARGSKSEARVLTVTVRRDGFEGRGECVPYARYGESMDSVTALIADLPSDVVREHLQSLLPAGAARNAVDCALWDLEAKKAGRRVWEIAGHAAPGPLTTAFTLSLDTPERMRAAAARQAHRPMLKIKLGSEGDMARLEAVRQGAAASRIIVDANEGWTAEVYAMFSLGHADVFAPGDLALQEAARVLFDLPDRPRERDLRAMAAEWSPWRSVAARGLWAYYRVVKNREGIR